MTYDELMDSILTAQEQMLKHCIEANSVTLNGRKYGKLIENLPPNMKPTIFGMAVKADYAMPDDYNFLVQYEPPQLKSNADRLRAMTDEELANLLCDLVYGRSDLFYAWGDSAPDCDRSCLGTVKTCRDCWLDWLKKEVQE